MCPSVCPNIYSLVCPSVPIYTPLNVLMFRLLFSPYLSHMYRCLSHWFSLCLSLCWFVCFVLLSYSFSYFPYPSHCTSVSFCVYPYFCLSIFSLVWPPRSNLLFILVCLSLFFFLCFSLCLCLFQSPHLYFSTLVIFSVWVSLYFISLSLSH